MLNVVTIRGAAEPISETPLQRRRRDAGVTSADVLYTGEAQLTDPNDSPRDAGTRRDPLHDLHARIDAALEDVRPKLKKALDELDAKVDAAVAEIKPRAQAAMREVQPKVDQLVNDMQPRLDTLLKRLQAKIEELRHELDTRAAKRAEKDEAEGPVAELPPGESQDEG